MSKNKREPINLAEIAGLYFPALPKDILSKSDEMSSTIQEDPWQGRTTGMKCRSCVFFVLKKPDSPQMLEEPCIPNIPVGVPVHRINNNRIGRCRANPPTATRGFPVVFEDDWCGGHRLDENKL